MSLLLLICLKAQFLKIIMNAHGLAICRFHSFRNHSPDQYGSVCHFITLPATPDFGVSSFHTLAMAVCFCNYSCIQLVAYFILFNKNAQEKKCFLWVINSKLVPVKLGWELK